MSKEGDVYKVLLIPKAAKEWKSLNNSIKQIFIKKLQSLVVNPITNNRLHGKLSNCYKIKLKRHGYRLVYEVRDKELVLITWSINKREDNVVYAKATERLRAISEAECSELEL